MNSRKFSDQKHINDAMAFIREAKDANLSRRDLLKLGMLSSAGAIVGLAVPRLRAQVTDFDFPPSPPTTPFIAPMPFPEPARPVTPAQLSSAAYGGRGPNPNAHQYYRRFRPERFYYLEVKESLHSFHPELPPFPIWGYSERVRQRTFLTR